MSEVPELSCTVEVVDFAYVLRVEESEMTDTFGLTFLADWAKREIQRKIEKDYEVSIPASLINVSSELDEARRVYVFRSIGPIYIPKKVKQI